MRRAVTATVVATTIGAAALGLASAGAQEGIGSMTATPDAAPVGASVLVEGTIDCPGQELGTAVLLSFFDPDEGPQTRGVLPDPPLQAGGAFSITVTIPAEVTQLQIGVGYVTMPVVAKGYEIHASCSYAAVGTPNTLRIPFTVTEAVTTTTTTTTQATTTTTTSTTMATTTTTAAFTPPPAPPTDTDPLTSLPATAAPGGTLQLDEDGFDPGEEVAVVLYSTPQVLATLTAGSTGAVQGTVTIPAGTTAGPHTLVLYGDTTVKAATITVQAPSAAPAPAAQQPPRTLPRTGAEAWLPAAIVAAALSLLAGAHLLGRSRRLAVRHTTDQ